MFKGLYQSASDELKLQFLDEILKKDGTLRSRFVEYRKNDGIATEEEDAPHTIIEGAKAELREELEHLDLEDIDWELEEYNTHLPEYDIRDQLAEKKVKDEFDIFCSGLKNDLKNGQVDHFFLSLAGAYEACIKAGLQNTPEAEMLSSFRRLQMLNEQWDELFPQLEKNIVPLYHFTRIITGLFEWHYYYHLSENKIVFNTDGSRFALLDEQPFLNFFDAKLMMLLDNRKKAEELEQLIRHWQIPENIIPLTVLTMHEYTDDRDQWEKSAQSFYLLDTTVATALLGYYEASVPEKFHRVAHQVWQQPYFREEFAEYFHQTLSYQDTPQLYKDVIRYLTKQNKTRDYYLEFRKIHTGNEVEAFIEEHQRDEKFFVMMMRIEEEYDKMLDYIANNLRSMNFNAMIRQIIDVKPKQSFPLIEQRIRNTLHNKRGRLV